MRKIGIVREVDPLGRITLPKEMRSQLNMDAGEKVEISATPDGIMLERYVEPHPVMEQLYLLNKAVGNMECSGDKKFEIDKKLIELGSLLR